MLLWLYGHGTPTNAIVGNGELGNTTTHLGSKRYHYYQPLPFGVVARAMVVSSTRYNSSCCICCRAITLGGSLVETRYSSFCVCHCAAGYQL